MRKEDSKDRQNLNGLIRTGFSSSGKSSKKFSRKMDLLTWFPISFFVSVLLL